MQASQNEQETRVDYPGIASGWQPIETAPKDGTWLLFFGEPARTTATMMIGRWDGSNWESADDGYGMYLTPSRWMPLPPNP